MRLQDMYPNVLTYTLEELIEKVERDNLKRAARLEEMTNIAVSERKRAPSSSTLTPQEKAILKALGLTMKDVKALQTENANDADAND